MKKQVCYADFETTQPNEKGRVKVYLWCLLYENSTKKEFGTSIESFINFIGKKHLKIYFHNARFDFSYIHYYLLEHNIQVEILEKLGVLYSAKFYNCEINDSMNFLPCTLEEVGLNYCNNYKKTTLDNYLVDYNHIPTKTEIEYCFNDCFTLKEGLQNYFNTLYEVLIEANAFDTAKNMRKKLTNAGIAFSAFKELSNYDSCCPKTTQQQYNDFKSAYKGGYVYSNPKGIQSNIQMIDCNSMYPFMYSKIEMPIGTPIFIDNEEDLQNFKFYIVKITGNYKLKNGFIPIIGGGISKFGGTLYKSVSECEETLTLSKQDYELIKNFYDCNFSFVCGWGFNTEKGFFKKYADVFIAMKNKYKGIKRNVVKVLLNSPYGKTAMNGLKDIYTYKINEESAIVEKTLTGYEIDDDMFNYFPIAIAITASARQYLLETACQIGFENVHYMDTDSIKFNKKSVPFKFDDNILGDWKDEGCVKYFKTIAPKKYGYFDGTKIHFKCAGVNQKSLVKFFKSGCDVSEDEAIDLLNKFDRGLHIECFQSHLVQGGRLIKEVVKELR